MKTRWLDQRPRGRNNARILIVQRVKVGIDPTHVREALFNSASLFQRYGTHSVSTGPHHRPPIRSAQHNDKDPCGDVTGT